MNDLDGCSESGCIVPSAGSAIRGKNEHSAEPFSASAQRVPYGRADGIREGKRLAVADLRESRLDGAAVVARQCVGRARS